jgi:hypothetical protein
MLLKSSRIRTTSGAGALLAHLRNREDNAAVSIVQGAAVDLNDAVEDARRFGRTYALRHWIVAPEKVLTRDQFQQCLVRLAEEFEFEATTAFVVEHQKSRAAADAHDRHWHVVVAEVDPASGRVLSNSNDWRRHEKVSRVLEFLFGHPLVVGAHDRAVIAALRAEGRNAVADWMGALSPGDRPSVTEAYTTANHQGAKRRGVDLALVRAIVMEAWTSTSSGTAFQDALTAHGLNLRPGKRPGVMAIFTDDGVFVGAGHRMTRTARAEFSARLETTHDHTADQRGTDDLRRYPGDQDGHGDHTGLGEDRRGADRGDRDELHRNRNGAPTDDRRGHRPDPKERGRASSPPGGAQYRSSLEPGDQRRLIATVTRAVQSVAALAASDTIAASFQQRAEKHLAGVEAAARQQIATAQNHPPPSSSALDAARHLHGSAAADHERLLARFRHLDAALPGPVPPKGLFSRLLGDGIQDDRERTTALIAEHAEVRRQLRAAEKLFLGSIAGLDRAEKAYAAAQMSDQRKTETLIREATITLAEVTQTTRMFRAYPRLVFCGPVFAHRTGQTVERARRRNEMRNPWAKDLWGLPIV